MEEYVSHFKFYIMQSDDLDCSLALFFIISLNEILIDLKFCK